ncbi:hypothetical protein [Psychrobacter ciconiae]|uniref:hypothetical protein n=1 Tax=Psychrobacter ciconiae TaxID=1553449 RepID=UPI00191AAD04|nr:hypothetical protein [Psychrobacter ciconiae]
MVNHKNTAFKSLMIVISMAVFCAPVIAATPSSPTFYQRAEIGYKNVLIRDLKQYQQSKNALERYTAYQAQGWLIFANYEQSQNHKTAAIKAFDNTQKLFDMLKQNKTATLNPSPFLPDSRPLVRPDLWAMLNALKHSGAISIAPREIALSEVALLWSQDNQRYPDQIGVQLRVVDRWLETAREAFVNAHDSADNVRLEELTNTYFKQYGL